MIEVMAAVSAATSAFNAIKKGVSVGQDIENMAGALGKWMGAVSDIKKAEEMNKKPPLFKKLFAAGSVEEEAMQIFMAKKKAEDMRDQLKQIIMLTRGIGAWEELLRTEADVRKRRQKMIYDQKERQKKLLDGILIGILMFILTGAIVGFIMLLQVRFNGKESVVRWTGLCYKFLFNINCIVCFRTSTSWRTIRRTKIKMGA